METMTNHAVLIKQLEELYPQGFPATLAGYHESWMRSARVYGEMLTQLPPEFAQALTSLRDLQNAELRFVVAALSERASK